MRVHGIYITTVSVRLRAGFGTVMRLSALQIMQHEMVGQWTGNDVNGSGPELSKPLNAMCLVFRTPMLLSAVSTMHCALRKG